MIAKKKARNLEYYLGLPYRIILEKWDDGEGSYWVARIAELPHCMTTGATPQEAAADIQDAKEEWLKSNLSRGFSIPEPSPSRHSGQIRLRIPQSLHRDLAIRAHVEGVSLNQFMTAALAKTLGIIEDREASPAGEQTEKPVRRYSRRTLAGVSSKDAAGYRAERTKELDSVKK